MLLIIPDWYPRIFNMLTSSQWWYIHVITIKPLLVEALGLYAADLQLLSSNVKTWISAVRAVFYSVECFLQLVSQNVGKYDLGLFFFFWGGCFFVVFFLNPCEAKCKLCLLKVKDERCASKCLCVCVVLASCVPRYSWCFSRWLKKKSTLSWKCRKTRVKCVPLPRTKISNNKNKACFLCYFHDWGFIFHMSHTHCP